MTQKRLGDVEFVGLIAMLMASIAFAVDTMLPGLPHIGAELSPDNPNLAQFVVTAFVLGMGGGTLFAGPISDAIGRKATVLAATVLYVTGALICYAAPSIEVMIAGRVLQGIGAAGPRAVGLAIVRDLYDGRRMARILSFVMTVFSLVPAVGPLFGSFIIAAYGWREVFLAFVAFMLVCALWLALRQPETLPKERRVRLTWGPLRKGLAEIFGNRVVVTSVLVLALTFGILFSTLVSIQPVFDTVFDRADSFPWWFALTALIAMSGSIINAWLVVRWGMRVMVAASLSGQALLSGLLALLNAQGLLGEALAFPAYFIWSTSVFWMMGLTIGNLNALALEPMGHIAGLASSVVSAAATVIAMLVAIPIGLAFDGTAVPVMTGVCIAATAALGLMWFTTGEKPGVAAP